MDQHEQPQAPDPQDQPQLAEQELTLEALSPDERLRVAAALLQT